MNSSTMRSVSSGELHEMCGDNRTCGWSYSQCPAGSGSGSQASRLARATRPESRATRSASWSTSGAAGDVHQMGAVLHGGERRRADEVVSARRGRSRHHDVVGVVEQLIEVGHQLDTGHRARRLGAAHGSHLHPERPAPVGPRGSRCCRGRPPRAAVGRAHRGEPIPSAPAPGSPNSREVASRTPAWRPARTPRSAPSPRPEQVTTRPSNASGGVPSTPVPNRCTQGTRACRPASAGDRCIASNTSPSYSGPSVSPPGTATTSVPGRAAVTSAATWSPIVERTRIRAVSPLPAGGAEPPSTARSTEAPSRYGAAGPAGSWR